MARARAGEGAGLSGKSVLIFGLGRHGGGAGCARYCARQGARVIVSDSKSEKEGLEASVAELRGERYAHEIVFHLGGHREEDVRGADVVIKNPAVPRGHPLLQLAGEIATDVSIFLDVVVGGAAGDAAGDAARATDAAGAGAGVTDAAGATDAAGGAAGATAAAGETGAAGDAARATGAAGGAAAAGATGAAGGAAGATGAAGAGAGVTDVAGATDAAGEAAGVTTAAGATDAAGGAAEVTTAARATDAAGGAAAAGAMGAAGATGAAGAGTAPAVDGRNRIIAVTGTKGKSTTVAALAHACRELGLPAIAAGNIGTSVLDILDDLTPQHIIILELSSFQLGDLHLVDTWGRRAGAGAGRGCRQAGGVAGCGNMYKFAARSSKLLRHNGRLPAR